jgi:hypothetical protein
MSNGRAFSITIAVLLWASRGEAGSGATPIDRRSLMHRIAD